MTNYKGVFEGLGYDVNSKGYVLFADLITDLIPLFREGKSEEEVRKVLPSYYLEQYHFVQEIGKDRYFKMLNDFCKNRKQIKKYNETRSIIGKTPSMDLDDSVLFFAGHFYRKEKSPNEGKKVFVYGHESAKIG